MLRWVGLKEVFSRTGIAVHGITAFVEERDWMKAVPVISTSIQRAFASGKPSFGTA
jgi:hypothetical protein